MKIYTTIRIRGEGQQWYGYVEADSENEVKRRVFNETWLDFTIVSCVIDDKTSVTVRCADISFVCFSDD